MTENSEMWRALRAAALAAALIGGAGAATAEESPASSSSSSASSASSPSVSDVPSTGETLYLQHCATCHMANGRGVPNFQPSLVGSPIVNGPTETLEATIWAGSSFLASQRENPFGANMPPFGYLSGEETKAIVAYVREAFGDARSVQAER